MMDVRYFPLLLVLFAAGWLAVSFYRYYREVRAQERAAEAVVESVDDPTTMLKWMLAWDSHPCKQYLDKHGGDASWVCTSCDREFDTTHGDGYPPMHMYMHHSVPANPDDQMGRA